MYRYSENWENFSEKYEGNLKKNLDVNDFTIKGSFTFWKDFFKFSGKRIFNTLPPDSIENKSRLSTASSCSLDMTFSPESNITLSQSDSGEATIEGEYQVWANDNNMHKVRLYGKHEIESCDNITTSNHVVYNYGLDYMFNAGVRDWKIKKGEEMMTPEIFSLGAMMRFTGDPKLHTWGGLQFAFGPRNFNEVKALVGLFTPDVNGVMQVALQKKSETIVTPLTSNQIAEKITYPKTLQVGLEAKLSDTFYLYNIFKSCFEVDFKTETQLGGLYTFDPSTSLKFKIGDDLTTTLSMTKRFRNLFDFTFSTQLGIKMPTKVETTTSTATVTTPTTATSVSVTTPKHILPHVTTKFGLALEILDNTLI